MNIIKSCPQAVTKMLKLIQSAAVIGAVALFIWGLAVGWDKNEIVECNRWLDESSQFVGWYSTNWQREQCKAHGITLPVGRE